MIKRKATGVLGEMLAKMDEKSLARTRNKMMVAARIADALKVKGITQKQMATLMGKTESEISEWLSGNRNLTIDTLTDIEEFLGIQLLYTRPINFFNVSSAPLKKKPENVCVVVPCSVAWDSGALTATNNNIFKLYAS